MTEIDGPGNKQLPQKEIDKLLAEGGLPAGEDISPLDLSRRVGDPGFISDFPGVVDDTSYFQPQVSGLKNPADTVVEPHIPPVIGEGAVNPAAQTEVDLTLVQADEFIKSPEPGADMDDLGDRYCDPEGLLLEEQMPDDGHDPIDPGSLEAAIDGAEDSGFADVLIFDGAEGPEGSDLDGASYAEMVEDPTEYTEDDFRKTMAKKHGTRRLMAIFDGLMGERMVFYPGDDDPPYLATGSQESPNRELYLDHISVIGEDSGRYFIGADGKLEIRVDGCLDGVPFMDLKNIRDSVNRLQKMFLLYHELLDEEPNFGGEETRFLDGATCLADDDPLETAYTKLSERQKQKLPGHEIVKLGNEELVVTVYNPGRARPLFEGSMGRYGRIEISVDYSGHRPIAFATISRGLDTLELGYKAFIGLNISPNKDS